MGGSGDWISGSGLWRGGRPGDGGHVRRSRDHGRYPDHTVYPDRYASPRPVPDVLPDGLPGNDHALSNADPSAGAPSGSLVCDDRAGGPDRSAVAAGAATDAGKPVGRERR